MRKKRFHTVSVPDRVLRVQRAGHVFGSDEVSGSMATYRRGCRSPYYEPKYYCPDCRLAQVPLTAFEDKDTFRRHRAVCPYRVKVPLMTTTE